MTDATSSADPLAYNEDGSAKDPIAFRDALMADPEKRAAIEQDKELAAVLLGDDTAKIQDVLRRLYAQQVRAEERRANVTLNSSDILRAQCPTRGTPRRSTRTCSSGPPVRSRVPAPLAGVDPRRGGRGAADHGHLRVTSPTETNPQTVRASLEKTRAPNSHSRRVVRMSNIVHTPS